MSLFGGMKIYTVHIKTDVVRSSEKPTFVREGFNVFAFFFTVLWALSKRLWLPAIGILAAFVFIITLGVQHYISSTSVGILQLMIQVIVGFHANDWYRAALEKRGFITTDITTGDSLLRAERRYLERYLDTISA
jgi:hypothetical protein